MKRPAPAARLGPAQPPGAFSRGPVAGDRDGDGVLTDAEGLGVGTGTFSCVLAGPTGGSRRWIWGRSGGVAGWLGAEGA